MPSGDCDTVDDPLNRHDAQAPLFASAVSSAPLPVSMHFDPLLNLLRDRYKRVCMFRLIRRHPVLGDRFNDAFEYTQGRGTMSTRCESPT